MSKDISSRQTIPALMHSGRPDKGRLVLALDIGGSSVKSCLLNVERNHLDFVARGDTAELPSREFNDLEFLVCRLVDEALNESPELSAIGISTTGSVDSMGTVVSAGHFSGYTNISWDTILRERYSRVKHVAVINDGRASAWAEFSANTAKVSSHIHLVVGTGVGGGIVHKGELLLGDSGQAGYIGHMKISFGETIICSCGKKGCVETLASAPAIVNHFFEQSGMKEGGPPSFDAICDLARQGNEAALDAFRRGGFFLGVGLGNAMNVLNPSQVSVGGGVVVYFI